MKQPLRHHVYTIALVIASITIPMLCGCTSNDSRDVSGYGWISLQTQVVDNDAASMSQPLSLTIATTDGAYSGSWPDVSDLSMFETFQVGQYIATATSGQIDAEGYDCQCYTGYANFSVTDGDTTPVQLTCTLQQAIVSVSVTDQADNYSIEGITLHTAGYGYNDVDMLSTSPMLIMPGATSCFVKLMSTDGKKVTLSMPKAMTTQSVTLSHIEVTAYDDKISISANEIMQDISITADVWDGLSPVIITRGFQSGVPISLIEGYPSEQTIAMDITSSTPLHSATLTLKGSYLTDQDIPTDCNLLDMPGHLIDMGLRATKASDNLLQVDFTQFIENLNVDVNDRLEFSVEATDIYGRASDIATLSFTILSVDLSLLTVTPAVLGENYATITVALSVDHAEQKDFAAYVVTDDMMSPIEVDMLKIDSESHIATAGFYVPEGIDPVQISIHYMDVPKLQFEVPREVPDFSINVDAFAHSAIITIGAVDDKQAEAICTYANVYANGQRTSIVQRDIDASQIHVIGLEPSTQYDVVVEALPNQYAATAMTITEGDPGVPLGDFEDFEFTYEFNNMPSGGTYSSAAFPIYTNRNYTDFSGSWVTKYWASVNDKTLCKNAKRYNTWYMQPSSVLDFSEYASGLKSMHLISVGWSLDGPEIPPYMQRPDEILKYNANAPEPDHVSAGKLFLGSYAFDATNCSETYNEGIEFSSRPSSLNGFYKYLPDINHDTDHGLVVVELLNDKGAEVQVIAHAEMRLDASPDFVSFNVPIRYVIPNLKATRLKIMFASSDRAGSIQAEDEHVPVTTDVEHARFTGSELWIDNLSFTY